MVVGALVPPHLAETSPFQGSSEDRRRNWGAGSRGTRPRGCLLSGRLPVRPGWSQGDDVGAIRETLEVPLRCGFRGPLGTWASGLQAASEYQRGESRPVSGRGPCDPEPGGVWVPGEERRRRLVGDFPNVWIPRLQKTK